MRSKRWNALHYAVALDQRQCVSALLKADCSLTIKDNGGMTPVHLACYKGNAACLSLLLLTQGHHRANVEAVDANGATALGVAAAKGHVVCARMLIEVGAELEGGVGQTALTQAAAYGKPACVELLITSGASLRAKGEDGRTALSWAVAMDDGRRPGHRHDTRVLIEDALKVWYQVWHTCTVLSSHDRPHSSTIELHPSYCYTPPLHQALPLHHSTISNV